MTRLWVALALLAAIFAGCLANAWCLDRFTGGVAAELERGEALARAGDWDGARAAAEEALRRWRGREACLRVLLRHADSDQIGADFQETLDWLDRREAEEYAAASAGLRLRLERLSGAERLTLENVL